MHAIHGQNTVIVKSQSHLESLSMKKLYELFEESEWKGVSLLTEYGLRKLAFIERVSVSEFMCLNFSNGLFLFGLPNTKIKSFNGWTNSFNATKIGMEISRNNFLVSKDYVEETADFYKLGLKDCNQKFLVNNNFIIQA